LLSLIIITNHHIIDTDWFDAALPLTLLFGQ